MKNTPEKPKKMGRPPLPAGQSKAAQIGVRLNPHEAAELAEAAEEKGISQAEEARKRIAAGMIPWVTCKWKVDDLRGRTMTIRKEFQGFLYNFKGEVSALGPKPSGEIAVRVTWTENGPGGAIIIHQPYLPQDYVDSIEEAPVELGTNFWLSMPFPRQ